MTDNTFDLYEIQSAVAQCYEESFLEGIPEDNELFERQKRDFVTRIKSFAQKTTPLSTVSTVRKCQFQMPKAPIEGSSKTRGRTHSSSSNTCVHSTSIFTINR